MTTAIHKLSQQEFQDALESMWEGSRDVQGVMGANREYLASMPLLTSRRAVQFYIAATAQGMQHGIIPSTQAKQMMYLAQLALAAFGTAQTDPDKPIALLAEGDD